MSLKTKILTTFFLINAIFNLIYSQNTDQFKEKYVSASYYYLYEDYEKALPLFLELYDLQPTNANLNFKIGFCYLQLDGQKTKAIPFLEFAVTNISTKHNEFSYKETSAPEVAYYRLGEAYHMNSEFDKAIEAYKKFKLYLKPNDIYNIDIVNKEIETCNNAKELYKYPVMIVKNNLGNLINSPYYDYNPVVSGDQNTLIYTSQRKLSQKELDSLGAGGVQIEDWIDEIFYSKKIDGAWSPARNISSELGSNGYCSSVYLSDDGTHLLIVKDDYYDGNIYESYLVNDVWTPIKKLNKHVNSKYFEAHACLTKDANTIYFSSDRKGGYGGFDVYKSEKNDKGEWGPATNLGSTVNTKFDDDTPFILDDNRTLYFSSEGHYNIGGFDIFYSYLSDNGKWSSPLNLGYPINTPDDNLFLYPVSKGEFTYFADAKTDGTNGTDLYMMKLIVPENPGEFEIKGRIKDSETGKRPNCLITVNMYDQQDNSLIATFYSNLETGNFTNNTVPGNYKLVFSSDNYKEHTEYLNIPRILYRKEFFLNINLIPGQMLASNDGLNQNAEIKNKEGYVAMKEISFSGDGISPDFDSKVELEKLSVLLKTNPNLKVELSGFSSSNINPSYDLLLAEKKQKAVIDYLKSTGINENRIRFTKTGIEDNLIAQNNNVEVKILKPVNDTLIADKNMFLPERNKIKDELTYSVIVKKSDNKLQPDFFNSYPTLAKIETLTDNEGKYLYISGNYSHQYDALKQLNDIVDLGFTDALLVDNYELEKMTSSAGMLADNTTKVQQQQQQQQQQQNSTTQTEDSGIIFTIQIGAYSSPVNINTTFGSLKEIRQHKGTDGKYRYLHGQYKSYKEAKDEWDNILKLGFSDAFIMNIDRYKE